MFNKLSFQQKLFTSLSVLIIIFTILTLAFQYEREKEFKRNQLENTLDNITTITNNYITNNNLKSEQQYKNIDSLETLLPKINIRTTVVSLTGKVLYDSEVADLSKMGNHLNRPEIQRSIIKGSGSSIRKSATTGNKYYYYAKHYKNYFIRTATHYNVTIIDFLKVRKLFFLYLISLFVIIWITLFILTKSLSKTLIKLKDFAILLSHEKEIPDSIIFPKDELGVISNQIIKIYKELNSAKNKIEVEKNKLFNHLQALNEGIAFFSADKKKILTNNHFIQYVNLISENSTISPEKFFKISKISPIIEFINKQIYTATVFKSNKFPHFEYNFSTNNNYFNIQCTFFQDNSFEIIIKNTTHLEKQRILKKQMTSNIAHELKTPVSTIIGYLETIRNNDLTTEKINYFIDKAFAQVNRLSDLIEDISIINIIEEDKTHYKFEPIDLKTIIDEVKEYMLIKLNSKSINVNISVKENTIINGNKFLLFSVFFNLFDNAINYGGENIEITVNNYLEDNNYYYFSFANTGNTIEDQHLTRIFERFYRVDSGRSRKKGGTGLGLSIVKNVIQLHKGEISARKYNKGGVEFLFSFQKQK